MNNLSPNFGTEKIQSVSSRYYTFEETHDSYKFSHFNNRLFLLFGKKFRIFIAVLCGLGVGFHIYQPSSLSQALLFSALGIFLLYIVILLFLRARIKPYLQKVKEAMKQGKVIKISGKAYTPEHTVEISK